MVGLEREVEEDSRESKGTKARQEVTTLQN